jgi:hypothetical protein
MTLDVNNKGIKKGRCQMTRRFTMPFRWSMVENEGVITAIWDWTPLGRIKLQEVELYTSEGEFQGTWARYNMAAVVVRYIENAIRDRYPHPPLRWVDQHGDPVESPKQRLLSED